MTVLLPRKYVVLGVCITFYLIMQRLVKYGSNEGRGGEAMVRGWGWWWWWYENKKTKTKNNNLYDATDFVWTFSSLGHYVGSSVLSICVNFKSEVRAFILNYDLQLRKPVSVLHHYCCLLAT